ncbi:RnfABCDGE type electron transport complex subunit D [Candidatus Xianfuyuplasma coldseepsis]|uniref:RnfABCDGE type electron transport complex subunit D n=1 Tax=Candidatus Xianfuyuplasma coldseepsis TaxID=2782163 RepID=A0A7L7KQG9_9MOLU|nr:RnfABCDGE type electron transport complex subunit D [Xianfuyuplasma coldseepsis]QMS84466.1 RnfABCDGE type electron transport complex subunit D [Xianfuyuplasma coldseepsis]
MNFTMKKPPIKNNQQRSYKRSLNLHISLLIVSVIAIITRAFIPVAAETSWAPDQLFKTFLMLVVGALVSVIIELLYALGEGSANDFSEYKRWIDPINSGLLIALLLPTSTPIYVLILAVFVGVYIGKLVFGGYGYYIFNPALVGVLFANISFGDFLSIGNTPLVQLKSVLVESASVNFNMVDLMLGHYEAYAIGSTSIILLTLLLIYLVVTKVIDWRISVTFIGTVSVISLIVGYINFGAGAVNFTLINLMTGLTMFGAVFLVAESVSSPTSREAKLVYAVVVAIMTMLVRVVGSSIEGVVFAVLLGNMITPFINRTVVRSDKQALIKTGISLAVVVLVVGAVLGFIVQSRLIEAFNAFIGGVL